MSTFSLDLKEFAAKAKERNHLVVKRVVAGLAESLIEKSPVGDGSYWKNPPPKGYIGGRFRANWDYGFGAAPGETFEAIDPTPSTSTLRILGKYQELHGVHFLMNNLPYAQALEDGHSRQAPHGMVAITVAQFQNIVRDAL